MSRFWGRFKEILRPGSPYLFGDVGAGAIPSAKFRFPAPGSQREFIPSGVEKEELTGYFFQKSRQNAIDFEREISKAPNYSLVPPVTECEMNLEKYFDKDGGPAEFIWKHRRWDTTSHKKNNPSYTKQ